MHPSPQAYAFGPGIVIYYETLQVAFLKIAAQRIADAQKLLKVLTTVCDNSKRGKIASNVVVAVFTTD